MERVLKWSFVAVLLIALCIACRDGIKSRREYGSWRVAWLSVRLHAWKRSVILTTLIAVGLLLGLPLFTYPFSYGLKGVAKGMHEAGEYALFALPAMAGIAAGGGVVLGRSEGEIINDNNVGFYMLSVLLLLGAHVVYLGMSFQPLVIVFSGLFACVAAIALLWSREHHRIKDDAMEKHSPSISLYELGYAAVFIAPPFMLMIIICWVVAYWNGLFSLE